MKFGYITECNFRLQGMFPAEVIAPCGSNFLDYIHENDGWCYCPFEKSKLFGQEPNCEISNIESKEHGYFIVQCLSFLYGQKLFTRPCEYIDSVRLKRDSFGLGINNKSIENALIYCNNSRNKYSLLMEGFEKRIFSIIHLLFMSQSKRLLQFEQFMYLYIAIDACYSVLLLQDKIIEAKYHADRFKKLESLLDIKFSDNINLLQMTNLRHCLFHEGMFHGEALGYKTLTSRENLISVQNFLIRAIFEILDISATGFPITVDTLNQTSIEIQ